MVDVSGDIAAHNVAAASHQYLIDEIDAVNAVVAALSGGETSDNHLLRFQVTASGQVQYSLDSGSSYTNFSGSSDTPTLAEVTALIDAIVHNDTTARSEALTAQTGLASHIVASVPHHAAIEALIEAHRAVSDAHHTQGMGGGGGDGLTAEAIAGLDAGATNSNTEIPSVHSGTLGKISIANIRAFMESSVGLGPRINPGPSLASVGYVPQVNAAGDAYELSARNEIPDALGDGELLVAHDGRWIAQLRPEQFPHVTELPPAVEGGSEFIYLDHTYALGGRRVDADIRFSRVGDFTGYSDSRLGTAVGTLSAPGPITRILVVADNTGLITRYNLVEFIDEESANRYDEIALGPDGTVPLYPLGQPSSRNCLRGRAARRRAGLIRHGTVYAGARRVGAQD